MTRAPLPPVGRSALVVLTATVVLVVASIRTHSQPDGLRLDVQAVPLNPVDPSQQEAGPLRFRGGLWLRSADPRFGGLSDLRVARDGSQLLAVSDCGYGFSARLEHDERGHLVGLDQGRLIDLRGLDGAPLERAGRDAEGLAQDGEDGLLVAFEGLPRLWRYARLPPFGAPAREHPMPPVDGACRGNRGLEVLVSLGDGRLFLACEPAASLVDTTIAWVGQGETWQARSYPLKGDGMTPFFGPTAAAALPGGDILLLERRFPPLGIRLVRVSAEDLGGNGPLSPVEVALLEPPVNLDNFEGLDVRQSASGATLVYMLSDDNGCSKRTGVNSPRLQRTLLLMFELEG